MATNITNIDAVSAIFKGQGDVVIFDEITNYATAKISSFANPKSLGDILQGSTDWSGDDISVTPIKNEQGLTVVTTTEAGTFGVTLTAMSISPAMVKLLLLGKDVSDTFATGGLVPVGSTELKFGTELPVIERPFLIANDTLNMSLIFPKATISSTLVMTDGVLGIRMSVDAGYIDTATLGTVMILNGALNYTAGS